MALEAFQIAIQEQFPEADFTKSKFGFSKNDPKYEKARTIFRRVTGQFKAYDKKRKTDPKRLEYRKNYVSPPESVAKRKAKQKLEYEKNPEKFLKRNREYLTRPDIQEKRSKYMQDRYYFGGQREKDLLRLKGVVASKGYGGYFKNPDNALLKDMVRMAEQNPDSGLEIIRKGPRNLIVGVKEGDTIYHAVASKRKPVAYAPKNSVPITEHPDFKTRFEFTKLQKNFLNTKLKGSDLTYGKALDILQSSKAGSALQNKNPAEFEHIKGAAVDYKEGQIALRTANRDKQKILAALENNNITLEDADKQLKKIGVRAFVDNKYIGAPNIDPNKQFNDLKKYVDRNFNKVNQLKEVYNNQPKGSPLRKYFEKNIAKCADGCFVKVANKNPEKILKNSFDDEKLIRLYRGEEPARRTELYKSFFKGDKPMYEESLVGRFYFDNPRDARYYAQRQGTLTGNVKSVDVPEKMVNIGKKVAERRRGPNLGGEVILPKKFVGKETINIPQTAMARAGAIVEKLKYDNIKGAFVNVNKGDSVAPQSEIKQYAVDNPMEVKVGEPAKLPKPNKSVLKTVGKTLAAVGAPLPTALLDTYFINEQVKQGKTTEEIVSNPLNWLGLATMSPLSKAAGIDKAGKVNTALRLGLNPGTIRGISRFVGLPGLALSTAMTAYDQYTKYKNQEGFIYKLFNKEES